MCRVAGNTVDPIWQVTLRSCEMEFHEQLDLYIYIYLFLTVNLQ